jgi:hypothetical protein
MLCLCCLIAVHSGNYKLLDCCSKQIARNAICGEMQIPPTQLVILNCTAGSVIIDGGAPSSAFAAFNTTVAGGKSVLPVLFLSANGFTVSPPQPFPWWIVVVAVIGALVLLAIILIVCCEKKRRGHSFHNRPNIDYIQLRSNK